MRFNQPELRALVVEWDKAITATDTHALKCKGGCHRRIPYSLEFGTDPYKPCARAIELQAAEDMARLAYVSSGGCLPTRE